MNNILQIIAINVAITMKLRKIFTLMPNTSILYGVRPLHDPFPVAILLTDKLYLWIHFAYIGCPSAVS